MKGIRNVLCSSADFVRRVGGDSATPADVGNPGDCPDFDNLGRYVPTSRGDPWQPLKKGLIQLRLEKDIAAVVPCLFRYGMPKDDGKDCRYCVSWRRGVIRFYVPDQFLKRLPGAIMKSITRIQKRYPNIRVQVYAIRNCERYPKHQDVFDTTHADD